MRKSCQSFAKKATHHNRLAWHAARLLIEAADSLLAASRASANPREKMRFEHLAAHAETAGEAIGLLSRKARGAA